MWDLYTYLPRHKPRAPLPDWGLGEGADALGPEGQHFGVSPGMSASLSRCYSPVNLVGSLRFCLAEILPIVGPVDAASVAAPIVGIGHKARPQTSVNHASGARQQERTGVFRGIRHYHEPRQAQHALPAFRVSGFRRARSEEHTSELQSQSNL